MNSRGDEVDLDGAGAFAEGGGAWFRGGGRRVGVLLFGDADVCS